MELLEKIVKRFKDKNYFCNELHLRCSLDLSAPLKSIYFGNTQKTNLRKFLLLSYRQTLISMKQDSTWEKIWRRTLLQKSAFATLAWNFKYLPSATPKLLNLNQDHPSKKRCFWSNLYKLEVMITSLIEMLGLPSLSHMSISTI